MIPAEQAVEIVTDNLDAKGLLSLPDVCKRCGLSIRTLNPRAASGDVKARSIFGKWYVTEEEAQRLEHFYKGTVSTGEAAKMLGMNHRKSIHFLMGKGLPYQQIGIEKRIKIEDVERERSKRNGTFVQPPEAIQEETPVILPSELEGFSKSIGLDLDWKGNHDDICVPVFYSYIDKEDNEDQQVKIVCNNRRICTVPRRTFRMLFGERLGRVSRDSEGDGEIRLVLHRLVELLFSVKDEVVTAQDDVRQIHA